MKILVPGIGNAQLDLIKYLKDNGHFVIGISYRKEGSGLKYITQFEQINITDIDAIIDFAENNKIDLIYSIGSDYALPAIAQVAERLALPCFFNSQHVKLATDKFELRNFLSENNMPDFQFMFAEKANDLKNWDIFPAVLKPIDSQGQRGVFKINNKEDIQKYFHLTIASSLNGKVIIENYVDGIEYSVNTYCHNGKLIYSFISERHVHEIKPFGLVKKHIMPANFDNTLSTKINVQISSILNLIGLQNGPAYFQIKIYEDKIYIIEFTPRLDGCHLWRLINFVYGVDLLTLSLEHLLENKFTGIKQHQPVKHILEFFTAETGSNFKKSDLNSINNGVYSEMYYDEGETIRAINGTLEKTGYFIEEG